MNGILQSIFTVATGANSIVARAAGKGGWPVWWGVHKARIQVQPRLSTLDIISCNNFECTSNSPFIHVIIIKNCHNPLVRWYRVWYVGVWCCTSAPFQLWSLSNFYTQWSLLPTFQILPQLFIFITSYLLDCSLHLLSYRDFINSYMFSLPVLWQLLRAAKSLVMGRKTFLDPAAGKWQILSCRF